MRYLRSYKIFESDNLQKIISDWRKTNSNLDNDFIDYCTPGIGYGDEYTHKKWSLALMFGSSLVDKYSLDKNHPLVIEYKFRIVEGEDPFKVIEDISKRVPNMDPNDFALTRLKELKELNEKLYESNNSNIIDDVNDMLLELNDEGFECNAFDRDELNPTRSSNVPMGYKLVKTHDVISVSFEKKDGFYFDSIKEVYYRIKQYFDDNGYYEDGNLENRLREAQMNHYPNSGKTQYSTATFLKPL